MVEQDEGGVVVGLIEKVVMDPFGEGAAVVNVFGLRVGGPGAEGRDAGLDDEPFVPLGEVVDAGGSGGVELMDDG